MRSILAFAFFFASSAAFATPAAILCYQAAKPILSKDGYTSAAAIKLCAGAKNPQEPIECYLLAKPILDKDGYRLSAGAVELCSNSSQM